MRALIIIVVMLVGVALTLAATGALYLITNSIQHMGSPLVRGLATAAALCVGVALLVTSVFISVKLAVAAGVRPGDDPPKTARIDTGYIRQVRDRNRN